MSWRRPCSRPAEEVKQARPGRKETLDGHGGKKKKAGMNTPLVTGNDDSWANENEKMMSDQHYT